MKKSWKIFLIFIAILILIFAISKFIPIKIGGQTDENNCLVGAGYSWCSSTEKCQRMWEEFCPEFADQFKITNFEKCLEAGNPAMESHPRQCEANKILYIEDLPGEKPKAYCLPDQRKVDFCTTQHDPVCGYFDSSDSECFFNQNCTQTFSNKCMACADKTVIFYRRGRC